MQNGLSKIGPVVPFGHRPANCLQASGFLLRADRTPFHANRLKCLGRACPEIRFWIFCGGNIEPERLSQHTPEQRPRPEFVMPKHRSAESATQYSQYYGVNRVNV